MAAGATPSRVETPAFEVERFGWAADGRLEVVGRWTGVRGRRFVRPSLDVRGGDGSRRLLAVLDHKPWAPDVVGEPWVAAFAWDGARSGVEGAELAVAPGVAVELEAPSGSSGSAPAPRRAAPAAAAPPPAPPAPPAPQRSPAERERDAAVASREAVARERDLAVEARDGVAQQLNLVTRERDDAIAARDALVADTERAVEEREIAVREAESLRENVAARVDAARTEALRSRDEAIRERDAAIAARTALEARLAAAPAPEEVEEVHELRRRLAAAPTEDELDAVRAELAAAHAALEAVRTQLAAARAEDADATAAFSAEEVAAAHDRSAEVAELQRLLDTTRAARDEAGRERDAAVRRLAQTTDVDALRQERDEALAEAERARRQVERDASRHGRAARVAEGVQRRVTPAAAARREARAIMARDENPGEPAATLWLSRALALTILIAALALAIVLLRVVV